MSQCACDSQVGKVSRSLLSFLNKQPAKQTQSFAVKVMGAMQEMQTRCKNLRDGMYVQDIVHYMKNHHLTDGDITAQVRSALLQLGQMGLTRDTSKKYKYIGPVANVMALHSEICRRAEMKRVEKIFWNKRHMDQMDKYETRGQAKAKPVGSLKKRSRSGCATSLPSSAKKTSNRHHQMLENGDHGRRERSKSAVTRNSACNANQANHANHANHAKPTNDGNTCYKNTCQKLICSTSRRSKSKQPHRACSKRTTATDKKNTNHSKYCTCNERRQ